MGNHHSSSSSSSGNGGGSGGGGSGSRTASTHGGGHHHLPSFRRTGALGLSKSELERRCKPSGLYPSCKWDERAIRRQIADGKLASRLTGSDIRSNPTDQECPICFLHYSEINLTNCCNATVCTECYLQIRPQKEKAVVCPFCNHNKMTVVVAKRLDIKEAEKRDTEEQTVIEAKIRARANTVESSGGGSTVDSASTDGNTNTGSGAAPSSPSRGGFGSSLEQHSSTILRTRSESISSADNDSNHPDSTSLALSSDDRRRIEEEMRAQLSHPLSRRMEAEAEERRFENEREYYRSNSHRLRSRRAAEAVLLRAHGGGGRRDRFSRMTSDTRLLSSNPNRSAGGRDWNQIVDAFEGGGNGEVQSLDDLVVIEAAILLSMEEEAARRRAAAQQQQQQQRNQNNTDGNDDNSNGGSNNEGGAAAGGSGGEGNNDEGENDAFDAAEQARAGFPMLRSRLGRSRLSDEQADDSIQELRHRGSSSRGYNDRQPLGGSSRNQLLTSMQRPSSTHMDTAGMLMRGISEEEQIAMALALSLRDAEAAQMRENNVSNNNTGDNAESNNEGAASSSSSSGVENNIDSAADGNNHVQTQEGGEDQGGVSNDSPAETISREDSNGNEISG